MNKLTKIIIIAIIIIMLAAGFFAFLPDKKPAEVADDTTTTGGFPDTGDSAGRASSGSSSIGRTISGSAGETNKANILTQLTKNAISGGAYYGTTTALYMERATGHIYKINLDGTNKIRLVQRHGTQKL